LHAVNTAPPGNRIQIAEFIDRQKQEPALKVSNPRGALDNLEEAVPRAATTILKTAGGPVLVRSPPSRIDRKRLTAPQRRAGPAGRPGPADEITPAASQLSTNREGSIM
jgi:hypothetical protein